EKLTLEELTPPNSSSRTNSVRMLLSAVNKLSAGQAYPGNLQIMKPAQPGHARIAWKETIPSFTTTSSSSTQVDWARFIKQMDGAKDALEGIRAAVANPSAVIPAWTGTAKGMSNLVLLRKGAHWLMGAILADLRKGDLEGALANIEALTAMAQINREDYSL